MLGTEASGTEIDSTCRNNVTDLGEAPIEEAIVSDSKDIVLSKGKGDRNGT